MLPHELNEIVLVQKGDGLLGLLSFKGRVAGKAAVETKMPFSPARSVPIKERILGPPDVLFLCFTCAFARHLRFGRDASPGPSRPHANVVLPPDSPS